MTQHLNLKFTVAHTDAILRAASKGHTSRVIAEAFPSHFGGIECTVEEVESICFEASQFILARTPAPPHRLVPYAGKERS